MTHPPPPPPPPPPPSPISPPPPIPSRHHAPADKAAAGDSFFRRARYGVVSLVILAAIFASCLIATTIAERQSVRIDLTSTREHTLSARTRGMLTKLDEPIEIVVNADMADPITRASMPPVRDLMDLFAATSDKVRITWVDIAQDPASNGFPGVIERLVAGASGPIEHHTRAIEDAAGRSEQLAADTLGVIERLDEGAAGLGDQAASELRRAIVAWRVQQDALVRAAQEAANASNATFGGHRIPESDRAIGALQPVLSALANSMAQVVPWLDQQAASLDRDAARRIGDLAASAQEIRDRAAGIMDTLDQLKPLEPLLVARLLQRQQAIVVFSPRGATAINFDSMFPPAAAVEGSSSAASLFVGEDLIATAIGSMNLEDNPIVVLVHAYPGSMFEPNPAPGSPGMRIGSMVEKLRLRRVDVTEWRVTHDALRPTLLDINPDGQRPVVWMVMPASPANDARSASGMAAAERAMATDRLARALGELLDSSESVLLSLEPSELPVIGEPDPVAEPLERFGIEADTGRMLVDVRDTAQGKALLAFQTARRANEQTLVGASINGLALRLPWATPITLGEAPNPVSNAPLVTMGNESGTVWGESQWRLWRNASPLSPVLPPMTPSPDPDRDAIADTWTLAASAEVDRVGASGRKQRLIVVGSPVWFEDYYLNAAQAVEGRPVLMFPGNGALLESSIAWLAGQDELVAPSPQVRDIARVRPLTPGQLAAIRWSLAAGLPVLVLVLGIGVRMLRG